MFEKVNPGHPDKMADRLAGGVCVWVVGDATIDGSESGQCSMVSDIFSTMVKIKNGEIEVF